MKDFGEALCIVGIQIHKDRSKRLIGLSQSVYINKALKRFSMSNSRKEMVPMALGKSLSKAGCPLISKPKIT